MIFTIFLNAFVAGTFFFYMMIVVIRQHQTCYR